MAFVAEWQYGMTQRRNALRLCVIPYCHSATNAMHLAGYSLRFDMPLCTMPYALCPMPYAFDFVEINDDNTSSAFS